MGCRLWGRTASDTTEATEQQQQPPLVGVWPGLPFAGEKSGVAGRRHANGQQVHEKILSTTTHQGDGGQSHSVLSARTH